MRTQVFWYAFLSVIFTLIRQNYGSEDKDGNSEGFNGQIGDLPCDRYVFSENHFSCRCNSTYCDTINPVEKPEKGKYVMYTSSLTKRFYRTEGEFEDSSKKQEGLFTIEVDKTNRNQRLFGFGGAFTDAAGINILSLPEKAQELLLRSYYSSEGIEYNFGRVPIGGTDFSTYPYTLDDEKPGDAELKYFSLTKEDHEYKIPLIKRASAMSQRHISLYASSWSSPTWMKTNDNITGFGFLKTEYYESYARYHVKFFEAYKKEGLTFWGVTTGNEPSDGLMPNVIKFNSMAWYPELQAKWIGENFGPAIRKSEFPDLKILCHDDQRLLLPGWVNTIMKNEEANKFIDGIAIHWYADKIVSPQVITKLKYSYPDKFIMNTEACQGSSGIGPKVILGSWKRAEIYVEDIMEDLHAGMNGWVEWNLALDLSGGPNWAQNNVDAPILVNKEKGEFYKQPMYYGLGHFSKFIKPGAFKVGVTPQKCRDFSALAAVNDDGSTIVVLQNRGLEAAQVNFVDKEEGLSKKFYLEGRSVHTIIY